ncbi:MAG TPA: response regulator [Candidatus Methylacidiphilales bacterium]|nr:response regulator [Candidatus Methylacidiphilales bacterium]
MPKKILIVDDQEDILLILEREFRRLRDTVVISTTKFADALSLVSDKQIDLVISDVRLGRESGFDLVREINRTRPEIGSILMSAYRSSGNRQQAQDLGVILFLEKPFQISRLIEEVQKHFASRDEPEAAAPAPLPVAAEESTMLAHFKLQDLVQLFCLNGRNILITVTPQNKEVSEIGEVYIQYGRVIHAGFDGKTGSEAFLALMRLPESLLRVKDWAAPVPVTIEMSWELLLLQSAIHRDRQEEGEDFDLLMNSDQQASGHS